MKTFFPTANNLGVRSFRRVSYLNGLAGAPQHDPAAAAPKPAMTPVLLGAAAAQNSSTVPNLSPVYMHRWPQSGSPSNATPGPISSQSSPTPRVSTQGFTHPQYTNVSSGGGVPVNATPASSSQASAVLGQFNSLLASFNNSIASGDLVTAQTTYAQLQGVALQLSTLGVQVALPTPPSTEIGAYAPAATAVPAGAVATPAASDANQVAGWLSGSTSLLGYQVPNALLAGGVVLLYAMFSGGKKR